MEAETCDDSLFAPANNFEQALAEIGAIRWLKLYLEVLATGYIKSCVKSLTMGLIMAVVGFFML